MKTPKPSGLANSIFNYLSASLCIAIDVNELPKKTTLARLAKFVSGKNVLTTEEIHSKKGFRVPTIEIGVKLSIEIFIISEDQKRGLKAIVSNHCKGSDTNEKQISFAVEHALEIATLNAEFETQKALYDLSVKIAKELEERNL